MLPPASSSPTRDSELIIVRGVPDKLSPRVAPKPSRRIALPATEPSPRRNRSTIEGGLSATTFVLLLALIWALWQWHKTSEAAQSAHHETKLSWNFADGVLSELTSARNENEVLDKSRRDLISALHQVEENGQSLKSVLDQWKQAHTELANVSQQTVSQWTNYSQQLEQNLGSTRVALTDTTANLERERSTAQKQIAELDSAKTAVEREANAFAVKAQSLEQQTAQLEQHTRNLSTEKSQLEGDVNHLRNCVNDLERRNTSLAADNIGLANRNTQLCSEVRELQHRITCLEAKLTGNDDDQRSKRR